MQVIHAKMEEHVDQEALDVAADKDGLVFFVKQLSMPAILIHVLTVQFVKTSFMILSANAQQVRFNIINKYIQDAIYINS